MTHEQAVNNLEFADYLEQEIPRQRFNMNYFCGTTCCIAGHWVLRKIATNMDAYASIIAKQAMGLSDREEKELFYWYPRGVMCISSMEMDELTKTRNKVTPSEAAAKIREIVFRHYPELEVQPDNIGIYEETFCGQEECLV